MSETVLRPGERLSLDAALYLLQRSYALSPDRGNLPGPEKVTEVLSYLAASRRETALVVAELSDGTTRIVSVTLEQHGSWSHGRYELLERTS